MLDVLRAFYFDILVPNGLEFKNNVFSKRKAFNYIMAVDSFSGHVFYYLNAMGDNRIAGIPDDSAFRVVLSKGSINFCVLRDVAKAQKHAMLKRGRPVVLKSSDMKDEETMDGPGPLGSAPFGCMDFSVPAPIYIEVENASEVFQVDAICSESIRILLGYVEGGNEWIDSSL